jgi:hypothetical protein
MAQCLLEARAPEAVQAGPSHPPQLTLGALGHQNREISNLREADRAHRVETLFADRFSAGLSPEAFATLSQAWKFATKSQYEFAWSQWLRFVKHQPFPLDPLRPPPPAFINYLQSLLSKDLKPATVATRKSALLTLMDSAAAGQIRANDQFQFFIQGMFKAQPSVQGASVWDAQPVLDKLSKYIFPHSSPYFFGRHLALLIQLFGGRRVHDLTLLTIHPTKLLFVDNQVWLQPNFGSKTDRYAKIQGPMKFVDGEHPLLSVPSLLRDYLALTAEMRGSCQALFIDPKNTQEKASIYKLRYWLKSLLEECGVGDSPGSTRPATATAGLLQGLTVEQVLERGNWASARTMFVHYFRP